LLLAESWRWISKDSALALVSRVEPCSEHIGAYEIPVHVPILSFIHKT
jgi:hypothetical protein